jgi:NADH-quinone oxidoreductase subunit I
VNNPTPASLAKPTFIDKTDMNKERRFTLPGSGIVKGMAVTAKNLVGSYFDREKLVTVQYPEEQSPQPENSRNVPFLVYDGDDPVDGLRCVSCHTCEKECPPQAISIVGERDENGKPVKHPRVFDIDISVCMGCQICAEVCPFDAITMDHYQDQSTVERFQSLILHKEQLAKSNNYFHQINPTDAADVDARLEADRRKKEAARRKRAAVAAK